MREKVHSAEFMLMNPDNGQFATLGNNRTNIGNISTLPSGMNASVAGKKIKQWGSRNDLPQYRDSLLGDNNIIPEMIDTKRNMLLGNGLIPYREIFENGKKRIELVEIPKDIANWQDESDFYDLYLDPAPVQFFKHANMFSEFVMNRGKGVSSVWSKDCKYIRACEKVNGTIPGYIYSPKWSQKWEKDEKMLAKADFIVPYIKNKFQPKFMLHVAENLQHDGYYGSPAYWGGEEWITVSNVIPVFHVNNLENGYSIRFLIKYPEGYFMDKFEYDEASAISQEDIRNQKVKQCLNNEAQAKQSFIDKMNDLLAGAKGAGRAIYVEETFNELLKEYKGVTIEPIEFDMKDEALLKLYAATNQANISGQGIHPTLANIESQGKLSSGSEMRNAFLFYVLTKLPRPRRLVLKTWDIICKLNGWKEKYPDYKWTFEDFEITKLDENKTGKSPMNPGGGDAASGEPNTN